jgi:Arc/MetJ-type ribon-helix-helix transcriptional regulator
LSEEKVQVSISKKLYEMAEKYIEKYGGFNSVNELVEFLLEEILKEEEGEKEAYTKEEEEKVKERLRALGYL